MGKKIKRVDIRCGCESTNVFPMYYRLFISATDVLIGKFQAIHKWFCADCHLEFKIEPEHQNEWRKRFAAAKSWDQNEEDKEG